VATVTIDRIAMIRADITDAVNKAAAGDPASRQEADDALVAACRLACGLLRDWLADGDLWQNVRPTDGTIADAIPRQDDFVRFLGPTFKDAIGMLAGHGIAIDASYVDEARIAVNETAKRRSKSKREALFEEARKRVAQLREEVCTLEGDLTTSSVRRRRAISLLKRTAKVLASVALQIALALTVTTQHEISHDVSVWAHDAVSVLVTHQIAHEAEPNLSIDPHGPELEMEVG
jgi:hypothetical protein